MASKSTFTPGGGHWEDFRSKQACEYMKCSELSWMADSMDYNIAQREYFEKIGMGMGEYPERTEQNQKLRNQMQYSGQYIFDAMKEGGD